MAKTDNTERDLMEDEDASRGKVVTPVKERVQSEDSKDREIERLRAQLFKMQKEQEWKDKKEERQADKGIRKPGISVVDEEGDYTKKKRPNSLGLSDLMMPPYTKKQIAIYKIIGSGQVNPATGEPAHLVDVLIPGRYTLFDRFELDPLKKDKIIQNITGTERYTEDGKQKVRDVVDDIVFANGYLAVPVESKFQLYVFMELHPNNRTNKWRPSNNTPVLFERVDIMHRSPAAKSAEQDLGIDAAIIIRDMSKEDLYKYAIPANVSVEKGRMLSDIRSDLTTFAMKDPIAFFKLKKDSKAGVKIIILDAINLGLLEYRPDKKSFYLSTTEEIFHTHTVGEEHMESLIKTMAKPENAEAFKVLTDQINFWQTD